MTESEVTNSLESSSFSVSGRYFASHGSKGKTVTFSGGSADASPTDRVEKLLKKYKVQSSSESSTSSPPTPRSSLTPSLPHRHHHHNHHSKLVVVELELWAALNSKLESCGYKGVEFEQEALTGSQDCLSLSVSSSAVARLTISCVLKELQQKDEAIRHLKLRLAASSPSSKSPEPLPPHHHHHRHSSPAMPSHEVDQVITELKSHVARLEYESAKLRVDLQNKPNLKELSDCQRRVKGLEVELLNSKMAQARLSKENSELLQCQQQIKKICSVISVSNGPSIVPKLKEMKEKLDSHRKLEQQFSDLLEMVYSDSNPKPSSTRCEERPTLASHPSGHDLWCEVTWGHLISTLQEWAYHLQGLKELQRVIGHVCQHLDLQASSESMQATGVREHKERRAEREGARAREEERALWFSCQEMAVLLRRWLTKKANMKSVSLQLLLSMVQHFQHLFHLPSLEGIYPTMNLLSRQVEMHRNVLARLKEMLKLGENCSSHKLVSTVELVLLRENSEFMDKIVKYLGPKMDIDRAIEKLQLCDEFFPAFQALVVEIQAFLGVNHLSEILPALYKLQSTR